MIIKPESKYLQYCGRIDFEDRNAPEFVYPCSSIRLKVSGCILRMTISNKRAYWGSYLGVIIDGEQKKIELPETEEKITLTLAENMENVMHDVLVFKRQDSCHIFKFFGFEAEEGAKLELPDALPSRRIEVYGDSVSAGEVSEAVDYAGKEDPEHNGEYSNSYYSYAWMTARRLNAQIHDVAQGGMALLHGTGWFMEPDYIGLEETYDKIQYHPGLSAPKQWDFSCYRPHVVIVAIGQNDNHPFDYMAEDYDSEEGKKWRSHYMAFVEKLRAIYPKAYIILSTTVLNHHPSWDQAIEEVCQELRKTDLRVSHFLYSQNGCRTPGHIRIAEAELMSEELAAYIDSLGDEVWNDEGVVNRGNLSRLKQCMRRAEAGELLGIGFIGGSITQGSLATEPEKCYAYHVYKWWKNKFPQTEFRYINAGIGGTTSQFGVARAKEDLLRYHPDFVIVEFSVNDENNEHFAQTYEGLIRKIYGDSCKPAVLLVHNIRYDNGESAEEQHLRIGKHYGLPSVSMKSTIYEKVKNGSLPVRDITPDDLHPNDEGHELVAGVIDSFLNQAYDEREVEEKEFDGIDGIKPLTENTYEQSVRYQNYNYPAKCDGFKPDTKRNEKITDFFRNGWTASSINDRIVIEIEGTGVAVQYRKSIHKPAPVARVTIDGDIRNSVLLDGNFDEDWGDCLYIDTVAEHLRDTVHTVEITIVESNGEVAVPFYLVSVIGSK